MEELENYTIKQLLDKTVRVVNGETKCFMNKCHYINTDLWKKDDPRHFKWVFEEVDAWEVLTELNELKKILIKLRTVRFEK